MACPKCGSEKIWSHGYYLTQKHGRRNRYKCKKCEISFTLGEHRGHLTQRKKNKIRALSKKLDPYASKYDHREIKTYSIREIARQLDITRGIVEWELKAMRKSKSKRKKIKS